jgi:hypothetical protein
MKTPPPTGPLGWFIAALATTVIGVILEKVFNQQKKD